MSIGTPIASGLMVKRTSLLQQNLFFEIQHFLAKKHFRSKKFGSLFFTDSYTSNDAKNQKNLLLFGGQIITALDY